uniref:Methyltransferase type 11 domain-containing protein n=1 Tax=Oryza meridionalis TaxID=40149 RepID=A0A0E0C8M6_9ORYZ
MDGHVRRLLNRVSIALAAVATAALLQLFRHSSSSCFVGFPAYSSLSLAPFPRTSCDAASRRVVDPNLRLAKLRSSPRWRRRSAALSTSVFPRLRRLRLLRRSSRVLCVAAGAGQAVDALHVAGVGDATGVDLVDFPPLVRRADPHNLPFFDGAFDVVLSDEPIALTGALFPSRFAAEAERTARWGGAIALAIERHIDLSTVVSLFKKSRVAAAWNATLDGSAATMICSKLDRITYVKLPSELLVVIHNLFSAISSVILTSSNASLYMITLMKDVGSSTACHGWYNIVCGIAIARRPELVLVGSHVANVALDQGESYPLTRRSGHERERHQFRMASATNLLLLVYQLLSSRYDVTALQVHVSFSSQNKRSGWNTIIGPMYVDRASVTTRPCRSSQFGPERNTKDEMNYTRLKLTVTSCKYTQ